MQTARRKAESDGGMSDDGAGYKATPADTSMAASARGICHGEGVVSCLCERCLSSSKAIWRYGIRCSSSMSVCVRAVGGSSSAVSTDRQTDDRAASRAGRRRHSILQADDIEPTAGRPARPDSRIPRGPRCGTSAPSGYMDLCDGSHLAFSEESRRLHACQLTLLPPCFLNSPTNGADRANRVRGHIVHPTHHAAPTSLFHLFLRNY